MASDVTGTLDEVVGVAPTGSASTPTALAYTMAAQAGTVSFSNLAPGTYVANAYVFDLPTVRGSSASFVVNP